MREPTRPPEPGKVITFYSYKGGTGRSMAVANISCLLAKRLSKTSQKVLVMDWDLEAPGLHRFFSAKSDSPEFESRPGVMNYFRDLEERLTKSPSLYDGLKSADGWQVLDDTLRLDDYLIPDVVSGVDLMRAGRFDSEYPKLVGSFSWIEFFDRYGAVIRSFRELVSNRFGYTLIDSRTGVTDVSGICTTLLPEKLVGVFTPNRQSLYGLIDLVSQAVEYRSGSNDFRPLSVFPLPSRVENAEEDLKQQWRKQYQEQFELLFRKLYETERCDLTAYFNDALLPHKSFYSYGENIAVLQEIQDATSLSAAYQRFFDRLLNSDFAWETPDVEELESAKRVSSAGSQATVKYDAFLSYAESDVKSISELQERLQHHGVKTFFPLNDIVPGEDFAEATSRAIAQSKAVVVLVGPSGVGVWKDQETLSALENVAKDPSKKIIPVLLPKAPSSDALHLPNFLRNVHWVDLREGLSDEQAIGNLIWALTGVRPVTTKPSPWRREVIGAVVLLLLVAGIAQGVRSLRYRGYIGPIAKCNNQVQQNPNDAEAHTNLGRALEDEGRTDDAIQQYLQALRVDPHYFGAAYSLDLLRYKVGNTKMITVSRDALKLTPDNAYLHGVLGHALVASGDIDGAVSEGRSATLLDPNNANLHDSLAFALEQKGDFRGALDEYAAATKIKPDNKEYSDAVSRLTEKLNKQTPVYIQIAHEAQRADAIQLQAAIQKLGFPVGEIEVELVSQSPMNTYVRYFWDDNAAQANEILLLMTKMGFVAATQQLPKDQPGGVVPHQIEVWIGQRSTVGKQ